MTDPIAVAARFLADPSHLEWIRHRPSDQVAEFLEDVESCWRAVVGIARGPAERTYLGPCGAPREAVDEEAEGGRVVYQDGECDGDIRAYPGATTGRCDRCGATVPVAERREWLDALVAVEAFSAVDIADAYDVRANTIRVWADRNQLRTYYRHEGRLVEWTKPHEGEDVKWRGDRLYMLAEVLERMREAAVRKAEREAAHARRKPRRRKEDAA